MSSRNLLRLHHTLAFRLTLWYAVIFTISSCTAFLFFYLLITSVIRQRTDRDLLDQVGKFSTLLSTNGIDAVSRIAIVEAQAAGEKKIFFRILSRYGEVFFSSNMSYWKDISVSGTAIKVLVQGNSYMFDTIIIPERKHKIRILYAVIGPGVILQLGQSMENYTRFIEAFQKIFVTTMVFLIVLAALVGWFMARRALSGLGEVTRTAQYISGGALDERVPVKPRGDEIDQLATTFNKMLDRIQNLVIGIREMSDNMAHDLKSPVTRIRGIAEITLTTDTSLKGYQNMAASTIEECDRLLDMINTMLLISKTEAGAGKIEYKKMDMAGIVRNACDLFQPLAEDNGISMTCNVQDKFTFCGDIRMIQRMIANLLDNAIKYTPSEGSVVVSVHSDDRRSVVVSVKDTGVGISPKNLPHIFERFYRCDPSRPQTGIGLGLSLAKTIAHAHGGNITVISIPDQGSTFTVTLPKLSESSKQPCPF